MKNKKKQDHYEALGVPRGATAEQVKAAHRRAVKRSHPDAGGTSGEFLAVQRAYEVLSDPGRRERYDAGGDDRDPQQSRAFDTAARAVVRAVEISIGGFGDSTDVLAAARVDLKSAKEKAESARRQFEAKAKQFRRRAERVKRREGDNALRRVLENVAEGIEQNARAAAEQEQLMAEALAYLDGYEYEFPDGPARGPVAAQWLVDGWRSTITTT